MTFRILVVCQANVCRSPAIAAVLDKSLAAEMDLTISSRGVRPALGRPACPAMSALLGPSSATERMLTSHQPTALAPGDLEDADLVLCADQRERAAAVRLLPTVRARAFTLSEAAQLVTGGGESLERPDDLAVLVSELNELRGTLAIPELETAHSHRFLPWRRVRYSSLDVPDAHHQSGASHAVVARRIVDLTGSLAVGLLALGARG
ncbi:MAG: hypothetical protein WBQ50_10415 [Nocardioides sp.]